MFAVARSVVGVLLVSHAQATMCPDPAAVAGFALLMGPTPRYCMMHAGLERCWWQHTPASMAGKTNVPLVMDLHGYSACADTNPYYTGWRELADANGFAVVWPQSTNLMESTENKTSWNCGGCCSAAAQKGIDDSGFLIKVVSAVVNETKKIDEGRIYMAGHSNGCCMAQAMGVKYSNNVAAVGCHSFYLLEAVPAAYKPVPFIEVHGTADNTVPYELPAAFLEKSLFSNPNSVTGAVSNEDVWAKLNGCGKNGTNGTLSPIITNPQDTMTVRTYNACSVGEVALVTIAGAGHLPFKGKDTNVSTTEYVWNFIKRYSRTNTSALPALASVNYYLNNLAPAGPPLVGLCAPCDPAGPCFSAAGCGAFDGTLWSAPYGLCNGGANACGPCYPDSVCGKPSTTTTAPSSNSGAANAVPTLAVGLLMCLW